jgi:hypothetical protein
MTVRRVLLSSAAALGLLLGAATASAQAVVNPAPEGDPRIGLSAGVFDAGTAAMGLELESATRPPAGFYDAEALYPLPTTEAEFRAFSERMRNNPPRYQPLSLANSDIAMANGKLFVGNFNGFNVFDVSQGAPQLVVSVVCPGGQGDLSVHGDLLFMSVEQNNGRIDCGTQAPDGQVSADRFRGIRIFDISDLTHPRQIAAVQTCRGSHTHTLVPSADRNVLYVYNQATGGVRKSEELSICSTGEPDANPETALYSIDVIKVPLDHPEQAAIVNRPRIFADKETGEIAGLWHGGRAGVSAQQTAQTNHCHDITVYPEMGIAGGACSGNGILLDISDPEHPARISEIFDADMAYWHSATFNNDATEVVFTDEWGGGLGARCTTADPANWGANLIASINDRQLTGQSFHKLPATQTRTENCVAHNGNIIPVPGRDLMVQAWYQGGVSIMDFTDPKKPVEIAFFDRGPLSTEGPVPSGQWSSYWMNGRIYGSEIARGVDVFKLVPSEHLSAAEIAAAESVHMDVINPQTQTKVSWADSPDVAQSYLDQLTRADKIDAALAGRVSTAIAGWRAGRPGGDAALVADLSAAAGSADGRDAARLKSLSDLFGRRA